MSNRQLLQDIQRRQKALRLQAINPDGVSEVLRVKESYGLADASVKTGNCLARASVKTKDSLV